MHALSVICFQLVFLSNMVMFAPRPSITSILLVPDPAIGFPVSLEEGELTPTVSRVFAGD